MKYCYKLLLLLHFTLLLINNICDAAVKTAPSLSLSVICEASKSEVIISGSNLPTFTCEKPSTDYDQNGWTARSTLKNDVDNTTGWGELYVQTPTSSSSDNAFLHAYSAGYIEGYISATNINLFWQSNIFAPQEKVVDFVDENNNWMKEQVGKNSDNNDDDSSYWNQVHVLLQQLQGLADGYNAALNNNNPKSPTYLSYEQLQYLQLQVELGDIEKAVDETTRYNFSNMSSDEMKRYELKELHCSAIFKVTPSLEDIYASHVTWSHYNDMLRFMKTYEMPIFYETKATKMKFSGYPGTLPGIDDFYITNQEMVIIETTNGFYNNTLYDFITTTTVPYWIRVLVANRMADTSPGWHDIFYKYNSGTYSNQWMTLDYKLFTPGQPIVDNTFVVSEQLPGHYHVEDQSITLQRNYWPSYNKIYYKNLYDLAGYPEMVKEKGVSESYQLAPRAKLFRRDAGKIVTIEDLQTFMRSNYYSKTSPDPLAATPLDAISARGDLMNPPIYGGAIDGKIASYELIKNFSIRAVSGPTHDTQPIFTWDNVSMKECPHVAQPETFGYDWENW